MRRTLLIASLVGCATAPPVKEAPKRLSKKRVAGIKARAGANFLDLEKRRAMKTKEERVQDLEQQPSRLTTLRPRKETPMPAPIRTKPEAKAEPVKPRGKPGWINRVPQADGTYIYGMGMANIEGDEGEAIIQARDRAFAALGSQLKVHVESVANGFRSSYADESGEQLASHYDEAIKAHVDSSLEGAEIHDQYSDDKQAFVLGRFNKAELEAKVAAQLAALQDEVLDQVEAGQKALAAGDSVKALGHGLRAALALRNLFGVPFKISGRPATQLVGDLVAKAASGMQLTMDQPPTGRVGSPLSFSAEVTSDGNPVDGVPLLFRVKAGPGSPERSTVSRGGNATISNWRIWGRSPSLLVSVDLATMARVDRGENRWFRAHYPNVVARLRLQMDLLLHPIRARLSGDEAPPSLVEGLAKKLGIDLVDDSSASLELQLSVSDARCKDLSMRRTCKVNGQLTVREGPVQKAQVTARGRGTNTDDGAAVEQANKRVGKGLVRALRRVLSR